MVGRRARKSMSGAANDSTIKFPISGKVPSEWLMHRLASPSPGHAQSVGVFVTPGRPTTRGFGLVDARSRWLCATCLDNVTPNTGSPCVATVQLGGSVLHASNCRAALLFNVVPLWSSCPRGEIGILCCVPKSMEFWMYCHPFSSSDLVAAWWTSVVLDVPSVSIGMIRPRRCIDAENLVSVGSRPRGGSAGPPHGEHRSARPYCRRCAPGLNWPGHSSGAVTLKKLECSKQAYACIH
ncbi:hypothetical protein V6N13_008608 [Hibiscus sabdariffa]